MASKSMLPNNLKRHSTSSQQAFVLDSFFSESKWSKNATVPHFTITKFQKRLYSHPTKLCTELLSLKSLTPLLKR